MEFKRFNEIAELVGIVAIVASLVFVGLQMQQSQRIALAEIEAVNASTSIEMASLISDNSGVWAKGIADEELEDSEIVVFKNIIIALSDTNYSMQEQFRLLDNDIYADGQVHEFAAFLHQRPGARRAWIERESELKNARESLHPSGAATVSQYIEMILADFAILDKREN